MSKTKKAVIIGSVLVGIGVIIGFIGIAIGGFKFPNGAVDLTTMKALHAEKKTVQIADAFDKIEIAGASSMDIEICKSKTGKNYVEYYDTDDWTSRVDVKDRVLKFTTDDKGKHKAIVSLGFGKDTAARYRPCRRMRIVPDGLRIKRLSAQRPVFYIGSSFRCSACRLSDSKVLCPARNHRDIHT